MLLRFKLLIAAVLAASVAAVAWLTYLYVAVGGFKFWLPSPGTTNPVSAEWANFGMFVGGLASPAIALIGSALVVLTLLAQIDALSQSAKQTSTAVAMQGLSWTRERLVAVMAGVVQQAGSNGKSLERLIAEHAAGAEVGKSSLEIAAALAAAPAVLKALLAYVEQLDAACSNLSPHSWPLRQERQWCAQVVSFYGAHTEALSIDSRVQLGFMQQLLAKETVR